MIYIFLATLGNGGFTRFDRYNPQMYKCFLSEPYAVEPWLTMLYLVKIIIPIIIVCTAMQTIVAVVHSSVQKCLYIVMSFLTVMTLFNLMQLFLFDTNLRYGIPLFDLLSYEMLVLLIIFAYGVAIVITNAQAHAFSAGLSNCFLRLI